MKRWNLFELFSRLDLPHDQLPPLYTKEDVSAHSVKKKVMKRLDSCGTLEMDQKPSRIKRTFMGFGIAAALIGGGAASYAASNMGEHRAESPINMIQTSITPEEMKDIQYRYPAISYDYVDMSQYTDAYDVEVIDEMDGLNFEDVKIQLTSSSVRLLMHFKAEDLDFIMQSINLQYGGSGHSYSSSISGYLSDEENLYFITDITFENCLVAGNQIWLKFGGLSEYGCDRISELGIKNLLGFTGAEISQRRPFTEEEQQYIDEYFISQEEATGTGGSCYYNKEDIYAMGMIGIRVDLTEKIYNKFTDSIPIPNDLNAYSDTLLYQNAQQAEIEDTMDMLDADIVGIRKDGYIVRVLMRYTPQNGYAFTSDDLAIFSDVNAKLFAAITGTEKRTRIQCDTTYFTYTFEGTEYQYVEQPYTSQEMQTEIYATHRLAENPCMFHEIEFTFPGDASDAELELKLINLKDDANDSLLDSGVITINVFLGDTGEYAYSVTDSFVTEDGFEIDARFSQESMVLEWDSSVGEGAPAFLLESQKEGDANFQSFTQEFNNPEFSIVSKQGYEYHLVTDILIDSSTKRVRASAMYDEVISPEDVVAVKFDGEVIYEAAQ